MTRPTPAVPAVKKTFKVRLPLFPRLKFVDGRIFVIAVTFPERLALKLHKEVAVQFVAWAVKVEIHGPLLAGTEIGVVGVKERQPSFADATRGPVETTDSEPEHAPVSSSARKATRETICPPRFKSV
jgi:hypothetical protein